jgi:hypothetical protein
MISPILNRNGSSVTDLTHPRIAARDALQAAIAALLQVTPHGRDYPSDSDRCQADRLAHYERIGGLEHLATELMAEAIAIKNPLEGK